MRRVRYQDCSLQLVKGKKHHVWTLRYYEPGPHGKRHYNRTRIGTTEEYPTKAAALKAAEAIRLAVNDSKALFKPVPFAAVIARYKREELPERFSTKTSYVSLLKRRIEPRVGRVSAEPDSNARSGDVARFAFVGTKNESEHSESHAPAF